MAGRKLNAFACQPDHRAGLGDFVQQVEILAAGAFREAAHLRVALEADRQAAADGVVCVGRTGVLEPPYIVMQSQLVQGGGQVAGFIVPRRVPERESSGGGVRRQALQLPEIVGRQRCIRVRAANPAAADGAFAHPLERQVTAVLARQPHSLGCRKRPRQCVEIQQVQVGL